MKYLLKNLSGKELEMDWTLDLLPEDIYREWQAFTSTKDYTTQIKEQRRIIANILNDFITEKRIGELRWGYRNDATTGNQERYPKYKFVMPKDAIWLVDERIVSRFRNLERTPIAQLDKNGNETSEVVYEGFMEIEEVADDYILEINNIAQDNTIDLFTGKKIWELRKMARERGLKPSPTTKMPELIAMIKEDMDK